MICFGTYSQAIFDSESFFNRAPSTKIHWPNELTENLLNYKNQKTRKTKFGRIDIFFKVNSKTS